MKRASALIAALLPALAFAQPAVEVRFGDLEKFTDLRLTLAGEEREKPDLADELRRHLERRAPAYLPRGARIEVTIDDVDMAGEFRPSPRSVHSMVRVVRGVYMPRIDLHFRAVAADGRVLAEGRRELRNPAFLTDARGRRDELLSHEKALLDRWLLREFPPERRAGRRQGS